MGRKARMPGKSQANFEAQKIEEIERDKDRERYFEERKNIILEKLKKAKLSDLPFALIHKLKKKRIDETIWLSKTPEEKLKILVENGPFRKTGTNDPKTLLWLGNVLGKVKVSREAPLVLSKAFELKHEINKSEIDEIRLSMQQISRDVIDYSKIKDEFEKILQLSKKYPDDPEIPALRTKFIKLWGQKSRELAKSQSLFDEVNSIENDLTTGIRDPIKLMARHMELVLLEGICKENNLAYIRGRISVLLKIVYGLLKKYT